MRIYETSGLDDPTLADSCEKAGKLASETLREVREAMGLGHN